MVKKILDIPKMRTINVKISDFSTLVLDPKKNERIKLFVKAVLNRLKL